MNSIIINLFLYLFLTNVVNSQLTTEWKEAIEKYSPLIWLDSQELYFPGKVEDFLPNVNPIVGGTSSEIAPGAPDKLTIYNLNFTTDDPSNVFLSSGNPAVDPQPPWMFGTKPSDDTVPPIYAIFVDKGNNDGKAHADVFYFTWYLFNLGPKVAVINDNIGNHVGDLEYVAIRFVDYNPTEVFVSEHANGKLYSPDLIEKNNEGRYVLYSAKGSHAIYTAAGEYCILKILKCVVEDVTSQGTAWNTWKNLQIFPYNDDIFNSGQNPDPYAWLNFQGHWGDQALPADDPRQVIYFNKFKKWDEGPTAPIVKGLRRDKLCQDQDDCDLITK